MLFTSTRAFVASALSLVLATQASATPPPVIGAISSSIARLTDRSTLSVRSDFDISDIPSQCQSKCSAVDPVSKCGDTKCLCTDDNGNGLNTCLSCIVAIAPSTDTTAAGQAVLDKFAATCKAGNLTVKGQTIAKNDAGRLEKNTFAIAGAVISAIGLGVVV